ncbi:MAG: dTDP-4-dehydrorhamnose 3,5-epimerase family protein [Deltaproteobacteria bacterium]|nr:dTDP-4-dehydrorhamnose 3,5-epimerase family protein [Deltaproteobacteria bacterium]MBI3294803.1 dTDP-4-dehydrorhamnose 3,5-epimerase family protein [Deltaproteobacteria bacterium]
MAFKAGQIDGVKVTPLKRFKDKRGWLVETFRHDELETEYFPTMGYSSETLPGLSRGPHEHVDQADLFVFMGPGTFRMWLWDNRSLSKTYENKWVFEGGDENPISVLVPKGVVHAYKNVSSFPAMVHNFPNQLYAGKNKKEPVDEIRHEDDPNTIYQLN